MSHDHQASEASVLGDVACPRCGCWLKRHFRCGCGDVDRDSCVNCGRWTDLPRDQYAELDGYDVLCEAGRVAHEHSDEEKSARISAWMSGLPKNQGPPSEWPKGELEKQRKRRP